MPGFLLFSMVIIAWSALNWYLEAQPWIKNRYEVKPHRVAVFNPFIRMYGFAVTTSRLFTDGKYLLIDLAITVSLTSIFGFGNGVEGGVLGMFTSNCISLIILITMYKDKKKREQQQLNTGTIS